MHRCRRLLGTLLLTMAVSIAFGEAAPEASAEYKVRREGPLAGMPSPAGPHIEKIWTNASLADGKSVQSGTATADQWGLVTLERVTVSKGKNRIIIVGD